MADGEKRKLPKLSTQKSWKSFPFLKFVEKLIYCQVCLKCEEKIKSCKNYNASFVVGCSNFRKSAVSEHSRTEMHRKAEELEKIENAEKLGEKHKKKPIPAENTPVGESIRNTGKLTENQQERLEKLFHIAYHVALRGRPYTDFVHELEIQKLHKVEFFKTKSYENESACRDFINFCSTSIFEETVRKKLVNSNFISILCDGSTDSSVVEKECIYVLFVDPETFQPNISFFSLRNVPSQDVVGVFSAIKKAFSDNGLELLLEKIVFLASDGA